MDQDVNRSSDNSDMDGEQVEMKELVPAEDEESSKTDQPQLKRELNLFYLVGMVVGGIIGSGIFISPKEVLSNVQSYGMAILVWVIAGVLGMGGGLCYSELGTLIKKSGGEFSYLKTAYSFTNKKKYHQVIGELLAFLFVWTTSLLGRPGSSAVILLTFGEYVTRAANPHCDEISTTTIRLLAISALGIILLLNCYSAKLSALLVTILSFVKLIAAALIIIVGVWQFSTGNKPKSAGLFENTTTDPAKIIFAFYAALWAYDGWGNLSYTVEEVKNVEKTLPRAILIGIPLIILVYILINVSFFAVLSIDEIINSESEAIAIPFGYKTMKETGLVIIPLIVACSTFGAANGGIFYVSRLNYAAARDGMYPKFLASIHTQYKTPVPAIVFHTVITSILIFSGGIIELLNGVSAAVWVFYTLCFVALIIMRFTVKKKRPFKIWIIVPILMTVSGVALILVPFSSPADSTYQFAALGIVLIGVPIYFVTIRGFLKPKILTKLNDQFAILSDKLLNSSSSLAPDK